jgi:uncharacterized protein
MEKRIIRFILFVALFGCVLDGAGQGVGSVPGTVPGSLSGSALGSMPRFRVLVLAETDDIHAPFVAAARPWLTKLAQDSNFAVDWLENPEPINEAFLSRYRVFIQLNYPPYGWSDTARRAFVKYMEEGRGGWIGFHHATLLGDFNGYRIWSWFSDFMGSIRFKGYIAGFATAMVHVERADHPCMQGLPDSFTVEKDEWYIYDKDPRPNVDVLARVDESSYSPASDLKMGDHPVIWSNPRMKARNVYIQMGHHPELFENMAYATLVRNAIFWAAGLPVISRRR